MTFEFEAGILLCGEIRDFLRKCRVRGMKIEWYEGRGWIEREWIIGGDPKDVQAVAHALKTWAVKVNST